MSKLMQDRIDVLMEKAQAGDVSAQYDLAECFSTGKWVEPSRDQAMYWAFKAVSSGKYDTSFYEKMLKLPK